jgi:hypothetical protein
MSMTISQALRRVKKLKGELETQLSHASTGVTFKVGKEPAFRFAPSLEKARALREELIKLETRVALTNARTTIHAPTGDMTLAEATKRLRELKSEIAWVKAINAREHAATSETERAYDYETEKHVSTTVSWACDLPVAKKEELTSSLQDSFDRLNDAVETANHRTELVSL